MIPLPTFDTDRLRIRPWVAGDAAAAFRIFSDPRVTRYTGGSGPQSESWMRDRILERQERYALRGWGMWAVTERESGSLVGNVGFAPLEGHPEIEIAYHYAPSAWGRGYATEAGTAALAYLTHRFAFPRILGLTFPANTASTHVLEKLGFRREGMGSYFGLDLNVLSVERPVPSGIATDLTLQLPQSPERVYRAFTDPQDLTRWFSREPEFEVTVGGRYGTGSGDAGRFLTVLPRERLRFTWEHPEHAPGTRVEVRFDEDADGTRVTLSHAGFASQADAEDLRRGWTEAFTALERHLGAVSRGRRY